MKRVIQLIAFLFTFVMMNADNYIESYNVISDNCLNSVQDSKIIRVINGGSVIIPSFDESCPEEMKAPFAYACKIVEEYMPPCLPIRVNVACGRVSGSSQNAISKILSLAKYDFGNSSKYNYSPMSMIKGVILAEFCHSSTVSYLDYVPDVDFLTENPDIEITYNSQKLDEISFSILKLSSLISETPIKGYYGYDLFK